jgi:hypothetical protein
MTPLRERMIAAMHMYLHVLDWPLVDLGLALPERPRCIPALLTAADQTLARGGCCPAS